jgi:diaminopimelate decarboxylase
MINQLAKKMDKVPRICFRLNPKVIVNTHKHISTGYKTHKFGLLAEDILQAEALPKYFSHTRLVGLSIHIGSQLTELDATKKAISNMCDCAKALKSSLEFLDVGGGLGVNYKPGQAPSIQTYMKLVFETLKEKDCLDKRIVFEPGRKIAASCGFFVSKVIRSKTSEECHFVIVDGGMNDFVRPSLYDAYHEIYSSTDTEEKITTDIVGPICETADCFGTNRTISKVKPGDYIVICDTGAYGHTMSSTYNMREKPKEFLID